MSKIVERYAGAIQGGTLKSEPNTTFANADVLGAAALAGKQVRAAETLDAAPGNPLGIALLRMFVGGDKEAKAVALSLTRMAKSKADEWREPIGWAGADLLAGLVLEWHRNSCCTECGGHGFQTAVGELGEGRVVMGDSACPACQGSTRRPFDPLFPPDRLQLALWLREKIEAEQAGAGVAAMRALAPALAL